MQLTLHCRPLFSTFTSLHILYVFIFFSLSSTLYTFFTFSLNSFTLMNFRKPLWVPLEVPAAFLSHFLCLHTRSCFLPHLFCNLFAPFTTFLQGLHASCLLLHSYFTPFKETYLAFIASCIKSPRFFFSFFFIDFYSCKVICIFSLSFSSWFFLRRVFLFLKNCTSLLSCISYSLIFLSRSSIFIYIYTVAYQSLHHYVYLFIYLSVNISVYLHAYVSIFLFV